MLYEIVNPSDAITFRAEDEKIAIALTALLGGGHYGLEDENGKSDYPSMLMFMKEEEINEKLKPYFADVKAMVQYTVDHAPEMIAALDSVAVVGIRGRKDYEKALEHITEEKERVKYKAWFNDEHRSSMNNIQGYALKMKADYEKRLKEDSPENKT